MKCAVCGYEVADGKSYCPVCNTKLTELGVNQTLSAAAVSPFDAKALDDDTVDMSWNTMDFPKPKKLEDIDMKWGNFNAYMNKDASEGFVAVKNDKPKKGLDDYVVFKPNPNPKPYVTTPAPAPVQAAPQPAPQPAPAAPKNEEPEKTFKRNVQAATAQQTRAAEPVFTAWSMPPQQTVSDTPLWYTQNFTASGVMKTGPAYAIPPQAVPAYEPAVKAYAPAEPAPAPAASVGARIAEPVTYPGLDAEQAFAAFQSVVPDATIQYMRVEPPKPVYEYTRPVPVFDPDKHAASQSVQTASAAPAAPAEATPIPMDDIPEESPAPAAPVFVQPAAAPGERKPEKFNTFIQKSEEFQKLLDMEYERIRSIHGDDYQPVVPERRIGGMEPEKSIKAQDISEFEKSLFGDRVLSDIKKESKPEGRFMHESDESEIDLDELIADPLNPNFNIHTLEQTISQLKEQEEKDEVKRSERRAKLAAMEAAREAYFRSLDEDLGIPAKTKPAVESPAEPETEKPAEAEKEIKTEAAAVVIPEVPDAVAINFDDYDDEEAASEAPIETKDAEAEKASEAPAEEKTEETSSEDNQDKPAENVEELLTEFADDKKPEDEAQEFEDDKRSTKDLDKMAQELKALYEDDDKEKAEPKKHGFGRFLLNLIIAIIIIALLFKLEVVLLTRFLPDHTFTETIQNIDSAVMQTLGNLLQNVTDSISSIMNKR